MRELPYLGLGLSTNLSAADVPNPFRLKDARPELVDFVEYSAPLSLERAREEASLFETMWQRKAELPALFHPVHLNLWGPKLEDPAQLAALAEQAKAVGSPWVGNDVGWWHSAGQPFPGYLYLSPPFDEDGLAECTAHALHVQSFLSVPLALENPAVIARRGKLHVLDFMAELHVRTGLPLILDLGHLLSFQLAAGHGSADGLDGFPLEQVIELHLAGGVVTHGGGMGRRGVYVDDHTQPVREELFALLSLVLPRCTSLRAVTFEGDGHPESIAVQTLERLRTILGQSPLALRERVGVRVPAEPVPALSESSRPWQIFSERFGAEPATEDAEGTRHELDLRLSIVAEALDRQFPLSRLLFAGTRDQLVSFTASAHFRNCFEGTGGRIDQAYVGFVRDRLRATPDEALAAVLAFEQWAQALLARPIRSDRVQPGVSVGQFPVDLSELLFASGALKRHLSHRGLGGGELDLSALSALPQIAARAPRRPWPVAVRRNPAGLSLVSLTARSARALAATADEAAWADAQQDGAALSELRAAGLLR